MGQPPRPRGRQRRRRRRWGRRAPLSQPRPRRGHLGRADAGARAPVRVFSRVLLARPGPAHAPSLPWSSRLFFIIIIIFMYILLCRRAARPPPPRRCRRRATSTRPGAAKAPPPPPPLPPAPPPRLTRPRWPRRRPGSIGSGACLLWVFRWRPGLTAPGRVPGGRYTAEDTHDNEDDNPFMAEEAYTRRKVRERVEGAVVWVCGFFLLFFFVFCFFPATRAPLTPE